MSSLQFLLESLVGVRRSRCLFQVLHVESDLRKEQGEQLSRVVLAQALNMLLFEDLLRRVPEGLAYVEGLRLHGRKALFDHGALRTLDITGPWPQGHRAFARILEPLGFEQAGVYSLTSLKATGRAFRHHDAPEALAQFFVSELHTEGRSPAFIEAAERLFEGAEDPLSPLASGLLEKLGRVGALDGAEARVLLRDLLACFDRTHAIPNLEDYQTLLNESPEIAWFATEGSAYNHAADRIADVVGTAEALKQQGMPMKEAVETSRSGRVFQTATLATPVQRAFRTKTGQILLRSVPGSFFEFITRKSLPDGSLDLSFDVGNATGIFRVTAPAD